MKRNFNFDLNPIAFIAGIIVLFQILYIVDCIIHGAPK